jgi:hypothetical protein
MFYEAVQSQRYFDRDRRYSEIKWSSLSKVVDAFEKRMNDWYLEPIRSLRAASGHYAFAVMALNCLLIDTLSQFESGSTESSAGAFKKYIHKRLKKFAGPVKYKIDYQRMDHGKLKTKQFSDIAEVLYTGFRCGILHQAHVPLYGSIRPANHRVSQRKSGLAVYAQSKTPCPSVIVNPWKLFEDLEHAFQRYVDELKDPATKHDQLRDNFKKKFNDSFGVDISKSTL